MPISAFGPMGRNLKPVSLEKQIAILCRGVCAPLAPPLSQIHPVRRYAVQAYARAEDIPKHCRFLAKAPIVLAGNGAIHQQAVTQQTRMERAFPSVLQCPIAAYASFQDGFGVDQLLGASRQSAQVY